MNRLARVHGTVHGRIDLETVLDVRAFDLEARAAESPTFMQEELPFEWAGLYDLKPGGYLLELAPGPDPTIDLVLGGPGLEQDKEFAEWKRRSILLYSGEAHRLDDALGVSASPGETLYRLPVDDARGARLAIDVAEPGRYVLLTQHLPEEFDLHLLDAAGTEQAAVQEHRYASPHEHDDSVASVGLRHPGELDAQRFEQWITQLLRTRGPDLFRTKGVLALKDKPNRFVFQGVHMLFDGSDGKPWATDDERGSQLVFIGRNLDRAALDAGLRWCSA